MGASNLADPFGPAEILELPEVMQWLLGYWIYRFTLGVVGSQPPLNGLRARNSDGSG